MRTFVVGGVHHCYGCSRPFPEGDPLVNADAQLEADLRALPDADAAARGFYALEQRRAREAAQMKLWLPRMGFAMADGTHVTVDGVSIVVPKPLTVERIPAIMAQTVDGNMLPSLRDNVLKMLFDQVAPPPAPPPTTTMALEFECPPNPRLAVLLGAHPATPTEVMYPHGYERLPDGSVEAAAASEQS